MKREGEERERERREETLISCRVRGRRCVFMWGCRAWQRGKNKIEKSQVEGEAHPQLARVWALDLNSRLCLCDTLR